MLVKVLGRHEVESNLDWADAIISIRNTHKTPVPFSTEIPMLILGFEDTERPSEIEWFHMKRGTADALDFGKKYEKVIVHCDAGVSRSSAIAWLLLVQDGMGGLEAFQSLLKQRPQIWPNQVLMDLGDGFLKKAGELSKLSSVVNAEISQRRTEFLGYGG